jgi:hypothetical protein
VKSVEELTALFRRCGHKVTAQRQCIFRVLQGDLSHPTAESVYEAARAEMETISLKTVYQTLNSLPWRRWQCWTWGPELRGSTLISKLCTTIWSADHVGRFVTFTPTSAM